MKKIVTNTFLVFIVFLGLVAISFLSQEKKRYTIPTNELKVKSTTSPIVWIEYKNHKIPLYQKHWKILQSEIVNGRRSLAIGQMENQYYTVILNRKIPLYYITSNNANKQSEMRFDTLTVKTN